jgi:hypothetical protein
MAPSDAEALAALQTLRAWLGGAAAPAALYSQTHLPPDAKSVDAYRRRHRALRKARVPGVWTRGKTLACTPEAWATDLTRLKLAPSSTAPTIPAIDIDAKLDAALGIRVTRGPTRRVA